MNEQERKSIPRFVSTRILSSFLSITPTRIGQLAATEILPRTQDSNRWEFEPCIRAYITFIRKGTNNNIIMSLTDEQARLTKAKADTAEIELKKMTGETINIEIASRIWGRLISDARQRLLGIPTKLAPILLNNHTTIPEIKNRIEISIREVLNELAESNIADFARMETYERNGEEFQTAAPINNKSMGGSKKKIKSRKQRGTRAMAYQ